MVTLVLSGALMTACRQEVPSETADWQGGSNLTNDGTVYTNNTYIPGRGYWHAPYHGWFYRPYNFFDPGRGYYHGGVYTQTPYNSPIVSSSPLSRSPATLGSRSSGSSASDSASSHVTRGGFGGTAKGTVS